MKFKSLLAALCCVSLSGCYSIDGAPQIINGGGVVNQNDTTTPARGENLTDNFRRAVDHAAVDTAGTAEVNRMVDTGVLLVRTNCDNFFREMGKVQRNSDIGRDMVAPLLSVLTGIVAVKNFSGGRSDRYLEIFALGSAAAYSGLDIADKHFLFGADNIHEVRQLTFKALAAHQEGIRRLGPMNFENAVMQLIDHQVVCTPASILQLTREAIAEGDVAPKETLVRSEEGISADEDALIALGNALGRQGAAVTPDQAGALWWWYRGGGDQASPEVQNIIGQKLAGLGSASPLVASGNGSFTRNGAVAGNADQIQQALSKITSDTRLAFESRIEAVVKDATMGFDLPAPRGVAPKIELEVS